MHYLSVKKDEWDKALERMLSSYVIYATVKNDFGLDYELLNPGNIRDISYNKPKPASSLKTFFLPVRENVTTERSDDRRRIILGAPACDIKGLRILDEIYLDKNFHDIYYSRKREESLLISADCFSMQEHCHCTSYGTKPYVNDGDADLGIILEGDLILIRVISKKGDDFIDQLTTLKPVEDEKIISGIEKVHEDLVSKLEEKNRKLPDYAATGELVNNARDEIWKKYSSRCVSCGACATICPTCSCFLLIDRPGFEKVRQLDACQYPGFERVAAGEDNLFDLHHRFRNRYMCKYVWKPEKFSSAACTGCGRCIEACLGKINKNELFMELAGN